jgi:hypothetical protein
MFSFICFPQNTRPTLPLGIFTSFAQQAQQADRVLKGASPKELLIEAARRNNTDLLKEVIDGCGSAEKAAVLLNETKTVLGNYIYHEAALKGNCACAYISTPPSLPRIWWTAPTRRNKCHSQTSTNIHPQTK